MPSLISSSTRLSSSRLRSSDLGIAAIFFLFYFIYRSFCISFIKKIVFMQECLDQTSKIPRMFNCKKRFLKKGAERDSLKKWIPIMEMQYRGAVYRDWCQGGLPEGKVLIALNCSENW